MKRLEELSREELYDLVIKLITINTENAPSVSADNLNTHIYNYAYMCEKKIMIDTIKIYSLFKDISMTDMNHIKESLKNKVNEYKECGTQETADLIKELHGSL